MDLRSYYFSRFLFLIIWSIVTDMKCQSHGEINAAACVWILSTYGLGAGGVVTDRFLGGKKNCRICKIPVCGLFSVWHSFILMHPLLQLLHPLEEVIYIDIIFMITACHGKSQSDIRNKPMWVLEQLIIVLICINSIYSFLPLAFKLLCLY